MATINIKVEVGSLPSKHLISEVGLHCAMQKTLCHWELLHSVTLTKTWDSVYFQYRRCQFLLKTSYLALYRLCASANLREDWVVSNHRCLSLDSSGLAHSQPLIIPSPPKLLERKWSDLLKNTNQVPFIAVNFPKTSP